MAEPDAEVDRLESRVGHPQVKFQALQAQIQERSLQQFTDIQDDWLDLMWTLDAYRTGGVPPRGMGDPKKAAPARLGAIYRGKGNWFADLLALLLENRTSLRLAPRVRVQGFSQTHQIDIAWPARDVDPLVCAETKLTGAPAAKNDPPRGAMNDWSNRRKELKFAATDLKLFRRQSETQIDHWGVWRENQPPKCYFLWAARLQPKDSISRMVNEAQALVNTYMDGAGVFGYRQRDGLAGYEAVSVPPSARVTDLDDVLYRIASEISRRAGPGRVTPPPELPTQRVVDTENLVGE